MNAQVRIGMTRLLAVLFKEGISCEERLEIFRGMLSFIGEEVLFVVKDRLLAIANNSDTRHEHRAISRKALDMIHT